jgi:hypothetical protein
MTFGIFHGGVADLPDVLATGIADDPDHVNHALDLLQGGKHLVVRTYLRYTGKEGESDGNRLPEAADLARYARNGRKLDLVLSNWDCTGNMAHWSRFIEQAIDRFGDFVEYLQICEEPNSFEYPGDGRFQHSVDGVISGVKAARAKILERRLPVKVGFNSVPCHSEDDPFWSEMARKIDDSFLKSLDYVGLNMYPDVAEPVRGSVADAVELTLANFRETTLAHARIPVSVPLRICEDGWPTGPMRYYTRQADVLEETIRKVCELSGRLNINGFGLYCLRDADTANPTYSGQFGIMRDDYSPKPSFETFRRLIEEFGGPLC